MGLGRVVLMSGNVKSNFKGKGKVMGGGYGKRNGQKRFTNSESKRLCGLLENLRMSKARRVGVNKVKANRRNHACQIRENKRHLQKQVRSIFTGANKIPRVVAIISLSKDVISFSSVERIGEAIERDIIPENIKQQINQPRGITWTSRMVGYGQNVTWLLPGRDLLQTLEACSIADYVVLVLSGDEEVDDLGEMMVRSIEGQGVSTILTAYQWTQATEHKERERKKVESSLKSWINHFFPSIDKLYNLNQRQDCVNLMGTICNTHPRGINWRDNRSWVSVENIFLSKELSNTNGLHESIIITGYIRGKPLKVNGLIQISDWGTFQITKITAACETNRESSNFPCGENNEVILALPTHEQDTLDRFSNSQIPKSSANSSPNLQNLQNFKTFPLPNPVILPKPEGTLNKQRWGIFIDGDTALNDLDGQRDFDGGFHDNADVPANKFRLSKKIPPGTSQYQSAWLLESDESDEDNNIQSALQTDTKCHSISQVRAHNNDHNLDSDIDMDTPYSHLDDTINYDSHPGLQEFRQKSKSDRNQNMRDNLEFPDEIELHPTEIARNRLKRYRGMKSEKWSNWTQEIDEPFMPELWPKLTKIPDYDKLGKQCLLNADICLDDNPPHTDNDTTMESPLHHSIPVGSKVNIYVNTSNANQFTLQQRTWSPLQETVQPDDPTYHRQTSLWKLDNASAVPVLQLLHNEGKWSGINVRLTLNSEVDVAVKCKEELIIQYGGRRFTIQPIFTEMGDTANNVHRMERYLYPGRTTIASFIGPIAWGPVPCIFFRRYSGPDPAPFHLQFIGSGTIVQAGLDRIMVKRLVLTGEPYRIHKHLVTVRYMFFHGDDVDWARGIELWTRSGRKGFIKEKLGTHGYFKAMFDGKINAMDTVAVSLYKRVWPREAIPFIPQTCAKSQLPEPCKP